MAEMVYGWVHRPEADEGPDPVRRLWVPTTNPEDLNLPPDLFVPAQTTEEALDLLRAVNPCPPWPEDVRKEANWDIQRVWADDARRAYGHHRIVESRWPTLIPSNSGYIRLSYAELFTKVVQPIVAASGAVALAPLENGSTRTAEELAAGFRKCEAFKAADVVVSEVKLKPFSSHLTWFWHVARYDPKKADLRRKVVAGKARKAKVDYEAHAALEKRQQGVTTAYRLARVAALALWADVPALLAFAGPGKDKYDYGRIGRILGQADSGRYYNTGLFDNSLKALFTTADLHEALTVKGRWRKHPAVREAVDAFAAVWADATDEKVSPGIRPVDPKDKEPKDDKKRPLGRWITLMGKEIERLKKTRVAEKAAATRAAKAVPVPAC